MRTVLQVVLFAHLIPSEVFILSNHGSSPENAMWQVLETGRII
jgi:hypothetical protein